MISMNNHGTPAIITHIEHAVDDAAHEILLMRIDEALTAKTPDACREVLDRTRRNMEGLAMVKGLFIQTLQGVEL